MIGRLSGKILASEDDGGVVVDVNGVGYDVTVPLGTLGRAGMEADGRVTLFVHTHVREDALSLFGFASDVERATFRALIAVSNIGPKTAVGLLGALPAEELGGAIAAKDVKRLTAVPGIGKKTAERLVLELADKLPKFGSAPLRHPTSPEKSVAGNASVVVSALTNMGYKAAEAERAMDGLADVEKKPVAELLREALSVLAK